MLSYASNIWGTLAVLVVVVGCVVAIIVNMIRKKKQGKNGCGCGCGCSGCPMSGSCHVASQQEPPEEK